MLLCFIKSQGLLISHIFKNVDWIRGLWVKKSLFEFFNSYEKVLIFEIIKLFFFKKVNNNYYNPPGKGLNH